VKPGDLEEHAREASGDGRFEIRYTQWRRVAYEPYDFWEADARWDVVRVATGEILATYTGTWTDTGERARDTTGVIDVRFDGDGYVVKTGVDTYEHHTL